MRVFVDVEYTKVGWCATLCVSMCAHVHLLIFAATPLQGCCYRDYCSTSVSWGTFWVIKEAAFWLPDSLTIPREEQGNQPWDWKHKFLSIFFSPPLPSLSPSRPLATNWTSAGTAGQSAAWRWRSRTRGGNGDNAARGARLGVLACPHRFYNLVLPSQGKKKGKD